MPPRVVTNQDLVDEYGIETSDEWIRTRTGIEERRFSDPGVWTSDLALHASRGDQVVQVPDPRGETAP